MSQVLQRKDRERGTLRTMTERLGEPVYLRNYWYPILRAQDLGLEPVGITRLGDDLVLWRDDDGVAHVQADCCPHRGTRLSGGDIEDGCIRCPYHHFMYDGNGQCTNAPFEGRKPRLAKKLQVRTFPSEEAFGLIWAWMSDNPKLLVPPLRVGHAGSGPDDDAARYPVGGVPYELASDDWIGWVEEFPSAGNWRLVLENASDIYHGVTLHAQTRRLSRFDGGPVRSEEEVVVRGTVTTSGGGVRCRMFIEGQGDPLGLTTFPPNFIRLNVGCGLSEAAVVNQWYVPVDYYSIVTYSTYQYPADASDADQFRDLHIAPGGVRETMEKIYDEDAMVVGGQINSWSNAHVDRLGGIDQPVSMLRRMVDRLVQDEELLRLQL